MEGAAVFVKCEWEREGSSNSAILKTGGKKIPGSYFLCYLPGNVFYYPVVVARRFLADNSKKMGLSIPMPENPRVLIVDDEANFCRSLQKILGARKIFASAVNRGEDALEALSRDPYDVVLLDVKMPGISGIEVLKQMKASGCKAEVIVLSGHASMETALEIVQHGAYDYLMKPCQTDELLLKISNAYEQRLEKEKIR